ncbi:hypothetical protein ZWY2020_016024 [Hordeum vulgare]|nr:hypothetical protein ZWY2020_016024 [Hordeum vulgare]
MATKKHSKHNQTSDALVYVDDAVVIVAVDDDLRSHIFRLRLAKRSATEALKKWASTGRRRAELARRHLPRRARRYKHALEVAEWMKTHHESDLSENDYGVRIDLITKVFGEAKRFSRPFTYNLRISASVASMDLEAFKGILDEISKDPNSNEGWMLYRNLASIYVDASQFVSSGNSLVEAEAKISQREWITYDSSSSCTPVSATWTG